MDMYCMGSKIMNSPLHSGANDYYIYVDEYQVNFFNLDVLICLLVFMVSPTTNILCRQRVKEGKSTGVVPIYLH